MIYILYNINIERERESERWKQIGSERHKKTQKFLVMILELA